MIGIQGYTDSLRALLAVSNVNAETGMRQRRLATGKRVNRAEEDSASVGIATKLEARIRGQAQALANVGAAKDLLSIKEQSLNSVQEILLRMKEKAIQGANDTLDTQARQLVTNQLQALAQEVSTVLTTASYGNVSLDTADSFNFQVSEAAGDSFEVQNSDGGPQTLTLGDLNEGIASWDALSGNGYIMYTEQNIYDRFGANPGIDRADNLVAVVNQGGQWYWSAWHGLTAFTPTSSDRLLAEVDFDADTVQNMQGVSTVVDGIAAGFESGDLVVTPNQFGNPPAASPDDFSVQGTQVVVTPLTLAQQLTFSASQLDVSTASSAQSTLSNVDAAIETVNDEVADVGRLQMVLTMKSELLDRAILDESKARSRIEDADFAREQIAVLKLQVLQNTGMAALSQSFVNQNGVLALL